jgi:hypothetical protein
MRECGCSPTGRITCISSWGVVKGGWSYCWEISCDRGPNKPLGNCTICGTYLNLARRDEQNPEVPVRFYRTEAGESPVLDWLRGLDKGDRRAIGLDLMRVQFGWPIREATDGKLQRWSLGSAFVASEPADIPARPMLSRSDARRAARVYQENAENAGG